MLRFTSGLVSLAVAYLHSMEPAQPAAVETCISDVRPECEHDAEHGDEPRPRRFAAPQNVTVQAALES